MSDIKFVLPDTKLMRISSCGRYLMVKRVDRDGKPITYEVWKYQMVATGLQDAAEALLEVKTMEATP